MNQTTELKTTIIQGFGTLILREFFIKLFSFFGQLVLARFLFPSDFGIYAVIVFITSFFGLFSDIGLPLAIIQKKEEPTKHELSSIFTLKVLLTCCLIGIIWIFSPFVRFLYPSLTNIHIIMLRIFAFTLLFSSIRMVSISLLEREIKYHIISLIDIIGVFFYYIVALICAYLSFGVWSFIIATLMKEIIETIILFFIKPFSIPFTLHIKSIKHMVKFGIYIQGNGVVSFMNASITPAIGGIVSGPFAVGVLDFANNIASIPETIAINFGRVAFTSYSRIQEQKTLLLHVVNQSISILSIFLYFFPILILCFGRELIHYIYTDKWMSALPALYWFSATAFFQPVNASLGQGILAIGKSKEIFRATLITTMVGWITAYLLILSFGFTGIAIASFFISFSLCLFYIQIFKRSGFAISILHIMRPISIVVLITTISSLVINSIFPSGLFYLLMKISISLFIYILLLFIVLKKDMKEVVSLSRIWLQKV